MPPQPIGGPMVLATADGRLLLGYRRRFHGRFPRRRLILTDIGDWRGSLPGNASVTGIVLRGDAHIFAANILELIAGGEEDEHVRIFDLAGNQLFGATDIAVPPQTWFGDDPGAPSALLAAQAALDVEWQAVLQSHPAEPRWVLEWQFLSGSAGDEMRVIGWDGNGDALVAGQAVLDQRCPNFPAASGQLGRQFWWGRIVPDAGGIWTWAMRDHGSPPAPVPQTRLGATRVEAVNSALEVDGVVQINPELAAGTMAFDGPFT